MVINMFKVQSIELAFLNIYNFQPSRIEAHVKQYHNCAHTSYQHLCSFACRCELDVLGAFGVADGNVTKVFVFFTTMESNTRSGSLTIDIQPTCFGSLQSTPHQHICMVFLHALEPIHERNDLFQPFFPLSEEAHQTTPCWCWFLLWALLGLLLPCSFLSHVPLMLTHLQPVLLP